MPNVRIKDQTTDTALTTGDYVIVDSETEGTRKYDLGALAARVEALEQGGSGLSQTEKNLILTLFSKAAYAESDAESAYDALEAMWTTTTRTITYNLSHVSSSNTTASVEQGQSYTTTLTASTNYTLNSVTVTMGGVDITSTSYSSGTVSIPSVTGNIVITASAVAAVSSISASYTQSGTIYDTDDLNKILTAGTLVVTATYADTSTATVPSSDYTLTGTLAAGTSTITVTYAEKTATFSVTVTEAVAAYNWDFTQSLTDSVGNVTATLTGVTRDSSGLHFIGATDYASLGQVFGANKTMVIELGTCERNTSTWEDSSTNGTNGILFWSDSSISFGFGWNKTYQSFGYYSNAYSSNGTSVTNNAAWKQFQSLNTTNALSNAVIKVTIDSNRIMHMYFNGTEIVPKKQNTSETMYIAFQYDSSCNTITLGSSKSAYPAFRDMTIKKLRIYSGVI